MNCCFKCRNTGLIKCNFCQGEFECDCSILNLRIPTKRCSTQGLCSLKIKCVKCLGTGNCLNCGGKCNCVINNKINIKNCVCTTEIEICIKCNGTGFCPICGFSCVTCKFNNLNQKCICQLKKCIFCNSTLIKCQICQALTCSNLLCLNKSCGCIKT